MFRTKTITVLRIGATERCSGRGVQKPAFARFSVSFDFRLLQQYLPRGDMASHLQMKRGRLSWRPLFPYWSLLGPVFVRRWRDTSRTRRRPRPRRTPRRRAAATRNRIPLNQKRLCVDLVHEDEWELDGTVRILTHKQPLRAGFAERTLATSSRTYGGCRPCHGSSKLRSRNAQPKPPL